MIIVKDLTVSYRQSGSCCEVLHNINLELAAGEICAIIGPSGCGKSTLLKVLAGIISEFEGSVSIDGQPLTPKKQTIGFIPQNYGLLPWQNVVQNILLGTRIKNCQLRAAALEPLLQQLGLDGLENRYPGELSGGQQQRVALARSFLLQPDLLLMDEPFSALDAITREDIQEVFLAAWQRRPAATLLVTHHVEEAVYLGQKIVILTKAPGRISTVLRNPLFGSEGLRSRRDFFELCRELRQMLKEVRAL